MSQVQNHCENTEARTRSEIAEAKASPQKSPSRLTACNQENSWLFTFLTKAQVAPGQAEAQEEKVSGEQVKGLEVKEVGEVEWRQLGRAEQFDQGCSVTLYSCLPAEVR